MNSMVYSLDELPNLVKKFDSELQLGGLYRAYEIKENVYDFKQMKPLLNEKCWAFEKDIKDTICCAEKPFVLKVDRSEFIPIVSSKK